MRGRVAPPRLGSRARRLARALLLALLAAPAPAAALLGDAQGPVGLDGSLRTVAAGIDNYSFRPFFGGAAGDALSQTLLRLTLVGRPRAWVSYEVHGVQSVDYASGGSALGALPFSLVPRDVRYRALDAARTWHEERQVTATLWFDRANVKLALPWADVTLGRQAITLGKTYFWNPLDVFLPFDPQQFDQEYKPGVDAVRLQVPLGRFAGLDVIGAAGRTLTALGTFADGDRALDATWFGSAVLGRAFTTVGGWDLALQGGKVYGGYELGGGLVGEVGPLEVRAEGAQLWADGSPPLFPGLFPASERQVEDAFTGVVGLGHRFPSSLTLEGEYFLNGAGDPDRLEAALVRFANGGTLALGRHLLGFLVSYEILPILTGQLGWIVDAGDPSVQLQPRLLWSAADEVDVLAGAIVGRGERPVEPVPGAVELRSEFGTFPDVYYVEVKLYF